MTDKEIRAYLAGIGAKGGQKGGLKRGKAKVRGDKAYYQRISKRGVAARRAKAKK